VGESLLAAKALRRVDFPALGKPTIPTASFELDISTPFRIYSEIIIELKLICP
jgi:hypothetical protein